MSKLTYIIVINNIIIIKFYISIIMLFTVQILNNNARTSSHVHQTDNIVTKLKLENHIKVLTFLLYR